MTTAPPVRFLPPKPAPPTPDAAAHIASLEADLAAARRELHLERALRRFPALEPHIDLVTASDEAGIARQVERLARAAGILPPATPEPTPKPVDADPLDDPAAATASA